MAKVDRLRFVGTFDSRDDAAPKIAAAGDVALVHRGVPRVLLVRCPCGCGDNLIVNLDRRSGKAWRMYQRGDRITLFPSYWRDSACESHFIVWNSRVHWCTWEQDEDFWSDAVEIEERVLSALPFHYVSYEDLADQIEELPWDVLQACHQLTHKGLAEANSGKRRGEFRRLSGPTRLNTYA